MKNKKLKDRKATGRRKAELKSKLIWGVVFSIVIGMLVLMIWIGARPAEGVSVPIANSGHVSDGEDIVYKSNPPSSGDHYTQPMPAGFYVETSPEYQIPNPEGYLVHGLEHGYVTFWYNCDILSEDQCSQLKTDILEVMNGYNNFKLVAWPWKSIDFPVVLTSWGQKLEMEEFDAEAAIKFIDVNKPKAPEANAQ